MKQYKDELLASCLTFVLALHHNIIAADIKAYCPALEVRRLLSSLLTDGDTTVGKNRNTSQTEEKCNVENPPNCEQTSGGLLRLIK